MRIGIDIDNVIFNTAETVLDVHYEDTGERLHLSDITDYNMTQFVGKKYRYHFPELFSDKRVIERLKPLENCVETINKMNSEYKHDILFVSANPVYIQPQSKEKFYDFLPLDALRRIIVAKNKSFVDIDILIDDCIDHASRHMFCRKKPAILLNYPWNKQSLVGGPRGLLYRADNWKDIDRLMFLMANFPE